MWEPQTFRSRLHVNRFRVPGQTFCKLVKLYTSTQQQQRERQQQQHFQKTANKKQKNKQQQTDET